MRLGEPWINKKSDMSIYFDIRCEGSHCRRRLPKESWLPCSSIRYCLTWILSAARWNCNGFSNPQKGEICSIKCKETSKGNAKLAKGTSHVLTITARDVYEPSKLTIKYSKVTWIHAVIHLNDTWISHWNASWKTWGCNDSHIWKKLHLHYP